MKTFRRIIVLALALVMSLSLFACGNGGGNTTDVTKYYEVDYQAMTDGKIALEFTGKAPAEKALMYQESSELSYSVGFEVKDNKLLVEVDGTMINANSDKYFYYENGGNKYVYYIKINAVTTNFIVTDRDESLVIPVAGQPENVKLNGAEAGAGVVATAESITVSKSVVETNKKAVLEYAVGDNVYVKSIFGVTKEQVRQPITFEDGEMSPFLTVFGADYEVVKGSDMFVDYENGTDKAAAERLKSMYTGVYKYTGAAPKNNEYALKIAMSKASLEEAALYVSSFYIKEKVAATTSITKEECGGWNDPSQKGANEFLEGNESRTLLYRIISDIQGWQFYRKINGEIVDKSNVSYVTIDETKLQSSQVMRTFALKDEYDQLISNGEFIACGIQICFPNAGDITKDFNLYVDDIIGSISTSGQALPSFPLPTVLAE